MGKLALKLKLEMVLDISKINLAFILKKKKDMRLTQCFMTPHMNFRSDDAVVLI
jgi:hypothetical protein